MVELLQIVHNREEVSHIDYWAGRQPCWEKCHCLEMIKAECPATIYQFLPCWEIEGTYCKLDDHGACGSDTSIGEVCRVYKKYGKGESIKLKLRGKGISTTPRQMQHAIK